MRVLLVHQRNDHSHTFTHQTRGTRNNFGFSILLNTECRCLNHNLLTLHNLSHLIHICFRQPKKIWKRPMTLNYSLQSGAPVSTFYSVWNLECMHTQEILVCLMHLLNGTKCQNHTTWKLDQTAMHYNIKTRFSKCPELYVFSSWVQFLTVGFDINSHMRIWHLLLENQTLCAETGVKSQLYTECVFIWMCEHAGEVFFFFCLSGFVGWSGL